MSGSKVLSRKSMSKLVLQGRLARQESGPPHVLAGQYSRLKPCSPQLSEVADVCKHILKSTEVSLGC